MISTVLWTAVFLSLAGLFAAQALQRLAILGYMRPADRFDNLQERITRTLKYAIGQFKFFKGPKHDRKAGILHAFVFWGFLILGYQVVHMFARGWFPHFSLPLMGAAEFGGPIIFLKDTFELL